MKKGAKNSLMWICSILSFGGMLVFFPSAASILFLLTGLMLLPVKRVQECWKRFLPSQKVKGVLAAVLFLGGCLAAPSTGAQAPPIMPAPQPSIEAKAPPQAAVLLDLPKEEHTPKPTDQSKPSAQPKPAAKPKPSEQPKPTDQSKPAEQPKPAPKPAKPDSVATPPVPQPEPQGEMVWVPRTGHRYHSKPNCGSMKNPTKMPIEKAKARGFTPCQNCY